MAAGFRTLADEKVGTEIESNTGALTIDDLDPELGLGGTDCRDHRLRGYAPRELYSWRAGIQRRLEFFCSKLQNKVREKVSLRCRPNLRDRVVRRLTVKNERCERAHRPGVRNRDAEFRTCLITVGRLKNRVL